MANNYTALPDVYLDECELLTDEEFGRLVRALMRYHMTGEAIEPQGNERFFARRFMQQEDRHAALYAELAEKRRSAGQKSASVRKQNGTSANKPKQNGTNVNKREQS